MSRSSQVLVSATALLAIFTVVASSQNLPGVPDQVSVRPLDQPYQTEQQWIVGEVVRAVVEMAAYARDRRPLPRTALAVGGISEGPTAIALGIANTRVSVSLDPYPWAPESYTSIARQFLGGAKATGGRDDADLLATLATPTSDKLVEASRRVASALEANFLDPSRHESAALVLAAFALRESSGSYADTRALQSRVAAHLAIAEALRGHRSWSVQGRLSEITLLALVGRQRDALSRLDRLERDGVSRPTRAWVRALRTRVTLDWRIIKATKNPSLLERLEQVRALSQAVNAEASFEYVRQYANEYVPDWGWRQLENTFTVAQGHVLAEPTLDTTWQEARRILGVRQVVDVRRHLLTALSERPAVSSIAASGNTVRVEILDRGTWAAFYHRHLAFTAHRGLYHRATMLGSKAAAMDFRQFADERIAGLPLYEVARAATADTEASYRAAMLNLSGIVTMNPTVVSYYNWTYAARWPPRGIRHMNVVPPPTDWYPRRFPQGTVSTPARLGLLNSNDSEVKTTIDQLYALAPWDPGLVSKYLWVHCDGGCPEPMMRAAYGSLADYHVPFMVDLAYASGDQAPVRLRAACDLSPEICWNLADWSLSRERFTDAVPVFEEYARRSQDPVAVSTRLRWLAHYYLDVNRPTDARRVGEMVAEAGSYGGMRTLGEVLYRTGHFEEGGGWFRQIRDRYDDGRELLGYFLREERAGRRADSAEHQELIQRYFPGGISRVRVSELSGAPATGALVQSTGWWAERAGFLRGDIVVAADAIRVSNPDQWQVAYSSSFDADIRVIVWRAGEYKEITAPFRRYCYTLTLEPYAARPSS